jgi:hypothetical protein
VTTIEAEGVHLETMSSADLAWFLNRVNEVSWKFAETMKAVPHSYVVRGRNWSDHDHVRAFGVLQTFGVPGKFRERTNIYLFDEGSQRRWWPMTTHYWQSKIINMATDNRMYGTQDAPSTESGRFTEYDRIGYVYDDLLNGTTAQERTGHWRVMMQAITRPKPRVLDLAAGTGGTIDAKMAGAALTTAVDPSQAMLNGLVMKHPTIGSVQPVTAEEFLSYGVGAFDAVVASFGGASHLSADAILETPYSAKQAVILSFYRNGVTMPEHRNGLLERPDDTEAKKVAASLARARHDVGNYVVYEIEGKA